MLLPIAIRNSICSNAFLSARFFSRRVGPSRRPGLTLRRVQLIPRRKKEFSKLPRGRKRRSIYIAKPVFFFIEAAMSGSRECPKERVTLATFHPRRLHDCPFLQLPLFYRIPSSWFPFFSLAVTFSPASSADTSIHASSQKRNRTLLYTGRVP